MCYRTDKPTTISFSQLSKLRQAEEQPKTSRKRRRPLVHFSLNNNTTTQSDNVCPSSTWYGEEELDSFRKEARLSTFSSPVVQLLVKESMMKSRSMQLDEKEVVYHKRRRKQIAIKAVLEAQRRLKDLPFDKEEKLAEVSNQFSKWSRDVAGRVAVMESFVNNDCELNNDNHVNKRQCLSTH